MKTLIVTDVQWDFYSPEGSLYVKGGELLPEKVAESARLADRVIFTLDWHPADHCSFKSKGGIWPPHCVQYTVGAGLAPEFIPILERGGDEVYLYYKGADRTREQYGAFEKPDPVVTAWLDSSDEIEICGIAGDYCVLETTKNIIANPEWRKKFSMHRDLTVSIDGGATLEEFITKNGLE